MSEDSAIPIIAKVLANNGDRGVVRGVIDDGATSDQSQLIALLTGQQAALDIISGNVLAIRNGPDQSGLTNNEQGRYKSIFKILKDILIPKGPEADSLKASNVGKVAEVDKINKVQSNEGSKDSSNLLSKLLVGGAIIAAAAAAFEALGPIGRTLLKAIPRLGKIMTSLVQVFDKVFKRINSAITRWPSAIGKFFNDNKLVRDIKSTTNRWFSAIGDLFKGNKLVKDIKSATTGWFSAIGDLFKGNKLVSSFLDGLGGAGKVGGSVLKGLRTAGGSILTVLKGALQGIGGPLLKKLKFVPFLGGIIGLGFAFKRFKDKDYIPATFELISAILDFIPAAGWVASSLIDGGLMLYDMHKAKEEKKAGTGQPKQGFLSYITGLISSKLLPVLEYLPVFGGLIQFGKAIALFASGNLTGGLKMFGSAIIATVGGKGLSDLVSGGINFITSLFGSKQQQPATMDTNTGESWSDIIKKVWKRVIEIVPQKIEEIREWALDKVAKFIPFMGDGDDVLPSDDRDYSDKAIRERHALKKKAAKKKLDQAAGSTIATTSAATITDNLQVDSQLGEINQQQLNTLNIISTNIAKLIDIGKENLNISNKTSREFKNSSSSPPNIKEYTAPKVRNLGIRDDFTNAYGLTPSS